MTAQIILPYLELFSFQEIKTIRAHGNAFGPQLDVTVLLHKDSHAGGPEDLIIHLGFTAFPDHFSPLIATCEFADDSKWQWTGKPLDPMAPEPPEFFQKLVRRITEELAIRGLGETYANAKDQADIAFQAWVDFDV